MEQQIKEFQYGFSGGERVFFKNMVYMGKIHLSEFSPN